MENQEIVEGQPRIAQHAVTTANTSGLQGEEAVKLVAAIPINEESPLLANDGNERGHNQGDDGSSPNTWYDSEFEGLPWYKKPGIFWIVGPFLIVALAFGGIIVTKLTLIQDLLCEEYFSSKLNADPTFSFMPVIIGQDNKQCEIPEVSSITAEFMLVAQLLSGIPAAIVAPILGAYSDRWGRTKVLAMTSAGSLVGEILTIIVATYPQTVSVYWMLMAYFFEGITGSFIVSMAVANAYASDCTPPPKRARAISFVYGCLFGGIAFGPLISAKLVEITGNIVAPFYMILGVHAAFILFLAFVVPESVPQKRQLAARKAWEESKLAAGPGARWRKVLSLPKALSVLWPRGPGSSAVLRRNLVLLAAVDTVCFGVAMGSMTVVIVYVRQVFEWDYAMTQYFVSISNVCRVTVLLGLFPLANRLFRGKSGPDRKHGHTGADQVDLGFIRFGILFDFLGFVGFAASPHGSLFIMSGALASIGGIVSPTLSSALTRHLPPHLTGQLLGALGLLHALARIISPAIFNGIFAVTTDSFPQTVFVGLACAFGVAETLSWFVKSNVYYDEASSGEDDLERPTSSDAPEIIANDI